MLPVVIVDDTREDILLAVRVIQQCKILNPVVTLTSGEEALRYFEGAREYADRTLPCLLFLDLAMSPMSGVEVLRRLGSYFQGGGSVAVMLSGIQDLKMVTEGYRSGATTFLVKPLRCEDLMQLTTAVRGIAIENTAEGYIISLDPLAKKRTGLLSVVF
jgi:CheY-like chemotaxis protein